MIHRVLTFFAVIFAGVLLFAAPAAAIDVNQQLCIDPNLAGTAACAADPTVDPIAGDNGALPRVIGLFAKIVGVISTIMIIYAGVRYISSNGDAGKIKEAKDTIIYAVVGLIIAVVGPPFVKYFISLIIT